MYGDQVEGRRSSGRLRVTWLETVEVYMAELETDREVFRDGRNGDECYKERGSLTLSENGL